MAVVKRYDTTITLPAVRLRLEDLKQLGKMLFNDVGGEKPYTLVKTAYGVTRIVAQSVDEFLQDEGDFPDELQWLSISGSDSFPPSQADKSFDFTASIDKIRVDFADDDEANLLGRKERLKRWLLQRRAWYGYFGIKPFVSALPFVLFWVSFIVLAFVVAGLATASKYHLSPYRLGFFGIGTLLVFIASIYFSGIIGSGSVHSIMPQFVLEVRPSHKPLTQANVMAILTVVGVLLAIIPLLFH